MRHMAQLAPFLYHAAEKNVSCMRYCAVLMMCILFTYATEA